MYTVTIVQSGTTITTVNENTVVKSTPTQYTEDSDYGNKKKVVCQMDYAIQPVEKVDNWTRTILQQNIVDETKFDLASIIKAVNNL